MRAWSMLMGLVCAAAAGAQPVLQVDTIRAVQPWEPHAEYTFPHLVLPERPAIAARIQRDLCIDLLEVDPDTAQGRYFDRVWGDTVGWTTPRLSYLEWTVRRPMPEVVEVELSAEGCGAYCEGFTTHDQYDLRSGRRLDYDSLFTPAGVSALNDTLLVLWKELLNAHIAQVVDSLADSEIDPEYVEFLKAELEMYRECLDGRADDPYVEDLQVGPDGIRFFISRCAPHAWLNLDELDPVSFVLPFAWCGRWMRDDLRSLFP